VPLRIPPGRAGRIWLVQRLEVARRGADVLDRKRQALLREQRRVREEAEQARAEWQKTAAEVALWSVRATTLDGPGRLELLVRHVEEPAAIDISWSNLMGARLPTAQTVELPTLPPVSALGGSSAAVFLAHACCHATHAAARAAAAQRADAELAAELRRTARRLTALRQRWIPQHETALAQLDLALDETQREEAVHARWRTRCHLVDRP
jgi:V/A-type H+-transporting ATPase subunit D